MSPLRPPRADALRNRTLILKAAEIEFSERGIGASMTQVAQRAGVAKGTVFSHFSNKDELVAEVVSGHFANLLSIAKTLSDSSDPVSALVTFANEAAVSLQQLDLAFLQEATDRNCVAMTVHDELINAADHLVDRVRQTGGMRTCVTGADMFLLICGIVHAVALTPRRQPELAQRYVEIVFGSIVLTPSVSVPSHDKRSNDSDI